MFRYPHLKSREKLRQLLSGLVGRAVRLGRNDNDAPSLACPRPGWTGLWAAWSGGRCPCPRQGGWNRMIYKVPPNPNRSKILRETDPNKTDDLAPSSSQRSLQMRNHAHSRERKKPSSIFRTCSHPWQTRPMATLQTTCCVAVSESLSGHTWWTRKGWRIIVGTFLMSWI